MIEKFKACYRRKYARVSNGKRESKVYLSSQVMKTMRARFGSFNEKLAQQLGRDLDPPGH